MKKTSKIFVAGHNGLVGSSLVRTLKTNGYTNVIHRTRSELDLLNEVETMNFFEVEKPEFVFLAAAKVGGIMANKTYPADFIFENMKIQNNVIHSAHISKVNKLLFLGSSCIYPKYAEQPITEDSLLTGSLEETNRAYAIAKISGIVMCQSYREQYGDNFISVMPTNLYGPNDNFNPKTSHVIPALIQKFHEAKIKNKPSVTLWGTGSAFREFLHVDDLSAACLFLMENYNESEIINIGTGKDISIKQLAEIVKDITNYEGDIIWDTTKPDGTPRKLLNISKLNSLGFTNKIDFKKGLEETYLWYVNHLIQK